MGQLHVEGDLGYVLLYVKIRSIDCEQRVAISKEEETSQKMLADKNLRLGATIVRL